MPKILKEPLIQFLVGGVFLYVLLSTFGPKDTSDDQKLILTNDAALQLYLQYRDKAFDTKSAKTALAALDDTARAQLEADYIRDEVMVREALALGLDANDEVIRRRLIQKMDFILNGFTPVDETFEPSELQAYFTANTGLYQIDAEATFTHIFFSNEKRGEPEAYKAAVELLPQLNQAATAFEKAGSYGDRFYFLRNYVKRSKRVISDHFGIDMTEGIFKKTPSNQWLGPFTSKYGAHLLLLRDLSPARDSKFEEVADQVLADLKRERLDKARAAAVAKLAKKYTIQRSAEAH